MSFSPLINRLMESLCCLPGVGPKSAQRMALHLLTRDPQAGKRLAQVMSEAIEKVGHCEQCRTLSETALCGICSNPGRDASLLCVVETPADVFAIEQSTGFKGHYFVLMGHLSPIDGIGPAQLQLPRLQERLAQGCVRELILATNPTVEGEATAHYIGEMAAALEILATRIAHGVPLGGELEYIDSGTLSHAFSGRKSVSSK